MQQIPQQIQHQATGTQFQPGQGYGQSPAQDAACSRSNTPHCTCGNPMRRHQAQAGKPENYGRFFWNCANGQCKTYYWEDQYGPGQIPLTPLPAFKKQKTGNVPIPRKPVPAPQMLPPPPPPPIDAQQWIDIVSKDAPDPPPIRDEYTAEKAYSAVVEMIDLIRTQMLAKQESYEKSMQEVCVILKEMVGVLKALDSHLEEHFLAPPAP